MTSSALRSANSSTAARRWRRHSAAALSARPPTGGAWTAANPSNRHASGCWVRRRYAPPAPWYAISGRGVMAEPWVQIALAVCVLCSLVSTGVAVSVWRQMRSGELGRAIAAGDRAVREHADHALGEVRETVADLRDELTDIRNIVARIEAHQESEEKHALRPRDLTPIHERLNRLGEQQAETRGELTEVTRMLREQLRILQTANMRVSMP